jgi:hypothetical protein
MSKAANRLVVAMALVVVGSTFDLSGQHGEDGLTSAQGLDLAVLIHAQHDDVMRRVHVQADYIARSFDSWAKLRTELFSANVLTPAHLTHAEEKFYRVESWQSPDTVPCTDEQMKEMKLKT